jgi:cell division transport system permease protein
MSGFLLLAAALQITNTIRIAAFTRRRELGIMRLVGASNLYIVLPFLLESLVAGLIGIMIAAIALSVGYYFVVVQNAQTLITALPWIGWSDVLTAILIVAAVGVALAVVPTLFATRKYVQI